MRLTPYQSQYYAWLLSRRTASDSADMLASTLVDAQVDLNPHQVDAALFAFHSPLSKGVILADEVGLGKTIEAGLVIAQRWAERKRRILVIVPANLRKQWHQELQEKFSLPALILEARSYNQSRKEGVRPFAPDNQIVVCSYQFAKAKAADLREIQWDLVVLDEAHRLRNVYKPGNVIGKALKESLAHARKVLLTATPLQNSLNELYGLVSLIDDRVFGDLASFREQFGNLAGGQAFERLRERLQPVCKRTLRRQVQPYISYTRRIPLVEQFTPSSDEQHLRDLVADYLRRPMLNALPSSQRQLISLVLWKLLASSSHAIAGALGTMADRLERELRAQPAAAEPVGLDDDYEALDETREEWPDESGMDEPASDQAAMRAELQDLRDFQDLAVNIRDNAKGEALLKALDRAFAELRRLGANRKALIFTESRRTQDYLLRLLDASPHAGKVVLFNGTNTGDQAKTIYADWLERGRGTDKITGSRTADTRAALVEHFRDQAEIMIATEAGAEGINLQFCSLVINYDLPWNPQRIEQRIGRCHRYGQKSDVVVVNFVDLSNPADLRVYELLAQKFQLFEGVFGASDEVLGTIGSGVDFERRIADIYQTCRDPKAIEDSFRQLQLDLSSEIDSAMLRTRQLLLENFDDAVQERLKTRQNASFNTRSRFERILMDLTETELGDCATYDADGFTLESAPEGVSAQEAPAGRYELPRRSGNAHLYRVGHPMAQALIARAKQRSMPAWGLRLRYDDHGAKVSTLEPLRGKSGWLAMRVFSVEALGAAEDELLVAAVTEDGEALHDEDAAKLLRLPADASQPIEVPQGMSDALSNVLARLELDCVRRANTRNLEFFEAEVQKIDGWADDLKSTLEGAVKDVDRQIKPERLIKRVLDISTKPGDLVLDSFAGSGTTGAVAHKMGRRWIMVEIGEHCHTHIIPRLKKVIDGEDPGGVTQATGWQGGGGFRYYELAPTLLTADRWGNLVVNPAYNPEMLAAAMCKLEGFTYAPSDAVWWQHGRSSECDFIYVTTQTLSADQLTALSDEVGTDRSLLVCCGAFRGASAAQAAERWPNLTIKKIPKTMRDHCEWGHDDYSLNVSNLPMAQKQPVAPAQDDLFAGDSR